MKSSSKPAWPLAILAVALFTATYPAARAKAEEEDVPLAPVIDASKGGDVIQPKSIIQGIDSQQKGTFGIDLWKGSCTAAEGSPLCGSIDCLPGEGPNGELGTVCCGTPCCPCQRCCRRMRLIGFADYLYLRPRNAEVPYAVPIDGPVTPTLGNGIQVGPTAVVDPDYNSAWRVGFGIRGCCGSTLYTQWTKFESNSFDNVAVAPPDLVRSLVTHPLGNDVATDGLQASANLDVDFELIDLGLRTPWKCCRGWKTEAIWAVRYGRLEEDFLSSIDVNGSTDVATAINFDGVGPQIGLATCRQLGCCGFYLYGLGDASFLVGTFDASYQQSDAFAGTQVFTSWEAGRIVPLLELELGLGWCTPGGRFHIHGGYLVNSWFNAVRTDEYIKAVQFNDPDGLGSGITFDGLVIRTELQF
jgi:hypothetical protein